jgi:hypothetical protein
MRRWGLVAAAIGVAACGGRPAPAAPDPGVVLPLHLLPGPYTLTLDLSDNATGGAIACDPPIGVSRVTLRVVLRRGDGDLTGEAQMVGASLRLRLVVSGDDRLISGTMAGAAVTEEGVAVDIFGATDRDPALVSGRADPTSVQGMVVGQLMVGGSRCTSAGRNWRLTPRE